MLGAQEKANPFFLVEPPIEAPTPNNVGRLSPSRFCSASMAPGNLIADLNHGSMNQDVRSQVQIGSPRPREPVVAKSAAGYPSLLNKSRSVCTGGRFREHGRTFALASLDGRPSLLSTPGILLLLQHLTTRSKRTTLRVCRSPRHARRCSVGLRYRHQDIDGKSDGRKDLSRPRHD